jgi:hypothetical protein
MKMSRLAMALTVINLVLLAFVVMEVRSATGQTAPGTLRGRVLEIVDERGVVRARLGVKAPSTVVELDLLDKSGLVRVKLGAGDGGSGIALFDETSGASQSYVQIIARRTGTAETPKTTSITLRGSDGRERVITPP